MHLPLATYVHHLDPFAIQFSENFGIRWYGLAYVAGFVAAFLLLRWFVQLRACELRRSEVADFITIVAIAGVMLGGRLGYMLLYSREQFFADPLVFFKFHQGGMSSHGAIFALVAVVGIYARYKKLSWAGLGDNLVTVAPVGVFFGRIANFVNGELWGRPTDSPLAMKFPDEIITTVEENGAHVWRYPLSDLREVAEKASRADPALRVDVENLARLHDGQNAYPAVAERILASARENEGVRDALAEILTPRHPSQLYEAAVEGLLLFAVLLAVRLLWKNAWHGMITGLFFLLYAAGRIVVENFREPDSNLIGALTKGQFYSIFMVLVGFAFCIYACVRKRRNHIRAGG